jgi:peptidoglycan/xylan/chitin deacetylase (PgdA/CDA1 family)
MSKYRIFRRVCALVLALSFVFCLLCGCDTDDERETGKNNKQTSSAKNESTQKKPSGKVVALTFDDGPHNVRTKAIADELEKYDYSATFFVVGNRVDGKTYNGASALKYVYEKGNEVAIHGYTHSVYYDECDDGRYDRELSRTYDAIKEVAPDAKIRLMRPIGGRITEERTSECDYSVIMWSVDSEDWKYKGRGENGEKAEENINIIVENVMSQVKSGDIILMHDIYENTYEATKIILKRLHDEGYDVVSVSELLGARAKAGTKYSRLPS